MSYTYAALQVLADAAKAVKSLDPQVVAEAIRTKGPFRTVIGELGLDAKGDITNSAYLFYRWDKGTDGKYTYAPLKQ